MSRRRPRGLRPDERELWAQVQRTAQALHPAQRAPLIAPPVAAPVPPPPPGFAVPAFRVGQTAGIPGPRHDLAPGVADRLAAAPPRMDAAKHRKMQRGKLDVEGRIDLHGLTLNAAHPRLVGFILSSHNTGRRLVLVITGKGRPDEGDGPIPRPRGLLRHQVPAWLSTPPLSGIVLQVAPAHRRHGGLGAYYVYLRRSR